MEDLVLELKSVIASAVPDLLAIPDEDAGKARTGGKWCRKEILGHLIDSASNNHQRFVRSQLQVELSFPAYQQESWVSVQKYAREPWRDLVRFWENYNRHLLHLISATPATALQNICTVGTNAPMTLEFLMRDYVSHAKHHLAQILEP